MSDMSTKEYMEKKLRLLYVQTCINFVMAVVSVVCITWLIMNSPEIFKAIQ